MPDNHLNKEKIMEKENQYNDPRQPRLGEYNRLRVKEVARREGYGEVFGMYLDGGREGDILMPQRYVPEGLQPGDEVECFIYLDQDERPIATTEKPLAKVGDFAYLEVKWVNEYGAFLGWGLMKDLFCPFHEMKRKMVIGDSHVVYVHIDEESYRIMASAKVDKFLDTSRPPYRPGDEVELLVWKKTDLGFKVIVDNRFAGLLYKDQIFQYVHAGDRMKGYISQVRPDGKIDVALQPAGRKQTTDFAETLYQYLMDNNGTCGLGDKSEADDIYARFHVSKKVFKRAVGDLYRRRLIEVSPMSIRLV